MKLSDADTLLVAVSQTQQWFLGRKDLPSVKFSYALAKNRRALADAMELANQALQSPDDNLLIEYDNARLALLRERCRRDTDGNPVLISNAFQFACPDDVHKIEARLEELFPGCADKLAAKAARRNEMLREETDIPLHKVKLADVPEMEPHLLDGLMPLIDEAD